MSCNNGKLSGVEKSKRSPRVNMVQKNWLVKLIQNHFIRNMGHYTNVNLEAIDTKSWNQFAKILNMRGPPKTPVQWKNCFYYMKNRIRKSVDMIRQCGASVKTNLSELDFRIYTMSPGYFGASSDLPGDSESNSLNADEESANDYEFENSANFVADHNLSDTADFGIDSYENLVEEPVVGTSENRRNTELKSETFGSQEESYRIVVAETPEQLEACMNMSLILSDEEEPHEDSETFGDENEENITEIDERRDSVIVSKGSQRSETSQVIVVQKSTTVTPKTGTKIPEMQKERLVQLVQNNFLKAFGRFSGENGKHIKAKLWRDIANELNTLGPHRTGEQWKTTFENIKASAKAKLADDHNNIDGTRRKDLTRLEEKVLSIYGIDVLDGNQGLGEAGFQYEKTVPARPRVNNESTEVHQFELEINETENSNSNRVNQNSHSLTEKNVCDDNESMPRSHDEYDDIVLEEILREIREEEEPVNNRVASSVNNILRIHDSTNVDRSEMTNLEGSLSVMNNLCPAGSTSTALLRVSQNHTNDGFGNRMRVTSDPSSAQNISLRGSSSSTHGRFSPITNSQRSSDGAANFPLNIGRGSTNLQGSQNRVGGGPLFRGSSSFASGRFLPITNSQRSSDFAENESLNIGRGSPNFQGSQNRVRGGPRFRGLSSSARGLFSPIRSTQRSNDGAENESTNVGRGRCILRGSQNRVRGVPRLRHRGASSSSGRLSPVTNINMFFTDNGIDDEEDRNPRGADESNTAVAEIATSDRTSLRHRVTSYEMVSRSINAQEEFIDQHMRNHSEVMYVTERNHSEMLGIINASLRTIADVAKGFGNRM